MENQEQDITLDDIYDSFGIEHGNTEDATETDPPAETAEDAVETDESSEGSNTEDTDSSENSEDINNEIEPKPTDKAAYAFGEMRKKIAEREKAIGAIGKILGISGNTDAIIEGIMKAQREKESKTTGVPAEILERLNALETEKAEREAKDREVRTYASINSFQKELGLSDADLKIFLGQLASSGLNPFEKEVNLKGEYLVRNLDKIKEAAANEALKKQAALDAQANDHSTNPGKTTGGGEPPKTEVKSVADLDNFLNNLLK